MPIAVSQVLDDGAQIRLRGSEVGRVHRNLAEECVMQEAGDRECEDTKNQVRCSFHCDCDVQPRQNSKLRAPSLC